MPISTAHELSRIIHQLQQERQQHADAVATIDAAFASIGMTPKPPVRRGRKPGLGRPAAVLAAKPVGKRGRRRRKAKDGMTGEQFLQTLLGGGKLATAIANKKWKESGRKGGANVLLGKLLKEGKVKRATVKVERGSVYTAARSQASRSKA